MPIKLIGDKTCNYVKKCAEGRGILIYTYIFERWERGRGCAKNLSDLAGTGRFLVPIRSSHTISLSPTTPNYTYHLIKRIPQPIIFHPIPNQSKN